MDRFKIHVLTRARCAIPFHHHPSTPNSRTPTHTHTNTRPWIDMDQTIANLTATFYLRTCFQRRHQLSPIPCSSFASAC